MDERGATVAVVCLDGASVAPLFALLDGRRSTGLRVDDGKAWELSLHIWRPGYRLFDDPCAPPAAAR